MHGEQTGGRESLDQYRQYLLVLARSQIRQQFQGKLDASDVVQDVLLRAYEKWDQFRGTSEAELAAWLRTILASRLANALRKLGRRHADLERSIEQSLSDSSLRLGMCLAADQSSPSQHVAKVDELQRLAGGLAGLPEDQRVVLELKHLQGLSVPAIARQLGRTTASVAGLLRRGLQTLRETLDSSG